MQDSNFYPRWQSHIFCALIFILPHFLHNERSPLICWVGIDSFSFFFWLVGHCFYPFKPDVWLRVKGPYLKISTRYWHLKIGSKWDFVIPWPTKIGVTRSIFEIEGSNFGFSPLFVCSTNAILQLRLYDQFLKKSFF